MSEHSDRYLQQCDRVLEAIATVPPTPGSTLTAFFARKGTRYDGRLFIVGRAVNGWEPKGWEPKSAASSEGRRAIIASSMQVASDQCPMRWVNDCMSWPNVHDYNARRSAFWRVIRRVAVTMGIPDDDTWSSHLAWSNLYKVAPSGGGNPSGALARAQESLLPGLLHEEVEMFRPSVLLLLTGRNWAEWTLKQLGVSIEWRSGLVEGTGKLHTSFVVVAKHPQAKPEDTFVSEVVVALRAAGAGIVPQGGR